MANIQKRTELQYDMLRSVVDTIKAAILQSQARAAQLVTQEQLGLYYGIGRYVSEHSRKGYWGTGAIENISTMLKSSAPAKIRLKSTSTILSFLRRYRNFRKWSASADCKFGSRDYRIAASGIRNHPPTATHQRRGLSRKRLLKHLLHSSCHHLP